MADAVQNAGDDLNQLTKNPTPTLTDDVEEFEEQQNDYQAMYNVGGSFKERLEAIARKIETPKVSEPEVTAATEIPTSPEVESEEEGYLEKIEKEQMLPAGLADDYVRQVGMTSADPTTASVKLPLTSDQVQQGLQHKVWEAIRWLAEWCLRRMKMLSLKRA